jgi:hypothetical protein
MFVPEGEPPREWAERCTTSAAGARCPGARHLRPAGEPPLIARDIATVFATPGRWGSAAAGSLGRQPLGDPAAVCLAVADPVVQAVW